MAEIEGHADTTVSNGVTPPRTHAQPDTPGVVGGRGEKGDGRERKVKGARV